VVNDLCPLTAPALRFEVNIGLQVDFPLVQIGFNLYKGRALPVKSVLAVIYKTVSDFIHFSAKMLFNAQTTKKWSANYRLAMRTLHDQTMLCEE